MSDTKGFLFVLANKNTKNTVTKCMSLTDMRVVLNNSSLKLEEARDKYIEFLDKCFPDYDTLFVFPSDKEEQVKIIYE